MRMASFRILLGASAVVLSTGVALSDDLAASQSPPATASGRCPATQLRPGTGLLYTASTTVRHNNVSRVRYTATHAMPSVHGRAAGEPQVACARPATSDSATLD